jgi:hypothetical protein
LKPQDKFKKELERQKRRAIHSSVMMELENEYSGAPEEIKVPNFLSFHLKKFLLSNIFIKRMLSEMFLKEKQLKKNIKLSMKKIILFARL